MLKRATFAIVFVLAGFVGGLVLTGHLRSASEGQAAQAQRPAGTSGRQAAQPGIPAGLPDFSAVAGHAVEGIVNISAESVVRRSNSPFADDPFFRQFFGDDNSDWFGSRLQKEQSLGSGVIVSPDGYVVTNNHVVDLEGNIREITAGLSDKREFKGRIIGRDPMTDIAVIKIAGTNLPVLPWGDSSKLKVGQWVLAIGSPFALNQTVTLGIVSALGRSGMGVAQLEDFIQTDAAINPGNSGGGLIDARGEVVGINSAILSRSGGYQGVGFAVSSNLARRVAEELIRYGEVRRGSIGVVQVTTLTPELAEQLGIRETSGAFVHGMNRNSAAYQAGIKPGDIIVSFNGQKVTNAEEFTKLLSDAKIGSTAAVEVVREGRRTTIRVPVTAPSNRTR